MLKDLFIHLQDTLATQVAAVRFCDFDLGQLEQPEPAVSYPCVLVRFGDADMMTLGLGAQLGTMSITLRIAFLLHERTHSVADAAYRSQALQILDTVDAVHTALQGSSGTTYGAWDRIHIGTEERADLRVFTMTYSVSIATPPTQELVPVPQYQQQQGLPVTPIELCNDGVSLED